VVPDEHDTEGGADEAGRGYTGGGGAFKQAPPPADPAASNVVPPLAPTPAARAPAAASGCGGGGGWGSGGGEGQLGWVRVGKEFGAVDARVTRTLRGGAGCGGRKIGGG
jgi:hypothetical protein